MICASCADGADIKNHPQATARRMILNQQKRERRHAACRGGTWCDCQHYGTPSYRQPGQSPQAVMV